MGQGSSPENFLKTKKAGEAISGHFVRTILPSVNEQFQRILLPFIVCSFLNINIKLKKRCPRSISSIAKPCEKTHFICLKS